MLARRKNFLPEKVGKYWTEWWVSEGCGISFFGVALLSGLSLCGPSREWGKEEREAARGPIQSLSTQKFIFVTLKNL